MNNTNQNQMPCGKQVSINLHEELPKNPCCPQPEPATQTVPVKLIKCCQPRPVKVDPCNNVKCGPQRFCTKVKYECENFDMTMYGKDCESNKGRKDNKCLCVKFNGLQDTCRHPGCYFKTADCFNIPFPTCPPARQWKYNMVCKNKKKTNDC